MDIGRGIRDEIEKLWNEHNLRRVLFDQIETLNVERIYPGSDVVDFKTALSLHNLETKIRLTYQGEVFEGVVTDEQITGNGQRSIMVAPVEPCLPNLNLDDPDDWYCPGPPEGTAGEKILDLDAWERYFKAASQSVQAAISPGFRALRKGFLDLVQQISPTLSHHLVCDHKVPCRPPGPGASLNPMITKQKRSRSSVARA